MSAGLPASSATRREQRRRRASVAVAVRKAHREAHPLAYARLWHAEGWDEAGKAPRKRTSQRAAVQAIYGQVSVAVFGGNGVGKSEAEAQLGVACMLGRYHPDTQAWLKANYIPPGLIPPYAGRVLMSAPTSDMSRKIVRLKVARYLPKGAEWSNRNGEGVADVRLPGLRPVGDTNGATIVFKSDDQGPDAFDGDEFDVVVNDEEPSYNVFDRQLARTMRRVVPGFEPWRDCWICHFCTLENGATWIYDQHHSEPRPGYSSAWLHAPDSPYTDMVALRRKYAGLSPEKLALRLFGTPSAGEGAVYKVFSRSAHLIRPVRIPASWPRFRAIDFGTRNPFCCLWFAVDPADTTIHVYRCYYQAGLSTKEAGAEVVRLSGGESYLFTVSDHDLDARRTLMLEYGMDTIAAEKSLTDGIDDVISYLTPDANDRVHLVFHDGPDMRPALREIEGYRYPDPSGKRDGTEAPLKRADHAMDALRYGVRFYRLTQEAR